MSIIIPTRRFDESLAARIASHRGLFPEAEIIVVEPSDLPPLDEQPLVATVGVQRLRAPRGRGTQCNAGAARATGSLLLFLHDDTALPTAAPEVVEDAFADPKTQVACFRLRFDHPHWLLASYAYFSRVDSTLTSFGDQGILIRRAFFANIGGFPDWPLFEDVDLLSRARQRIRGRIKKLPAAVTTSAVRFLENGILRQQLLNAELMLRFSLGASPESLRRRYEGRRGSAPSAGGDP
ncbi:MAG: TIGR04283 family arsenosugar biosynthesis glycosyltransferase [Lamprobacter sp.]|uniref:TIGR04283 family arsenosugar biosynthesis glycosyltransferase n=1 Tax=Lamprobacter sp. TaxID=3100796 RepID=UPI002B25AD30|nr:TIGR04283 family arsenosugar biosynthesis glycosyltransferase [Lamprobacter sp.]MEA3638633.1 TIGR04283 family arsenosugar biosynthesis glycosyltransferase [Lamprobacter sp.]